MFDLKIVSTASLPCRTLKFFSSFPYSSNSHRIQNLWDANTFSQLQLLLKGKFLNTGRKQIYFEEMDSDFCCLPPPHIFLHFKECKNNVSCDCFAGRYGVCMRGSIPMGFSSVTDDGKSKSQMRVFGSFMQSLCRRGLFWAWLKCEVFLIKSFVNPLAQLPQTPHSVQWIKNLVGNWGLENKP